MIDPAHVYLQSNCIYTDAFKATHLQYFTPWSISQLVQNVLLGTTKEPHQSELRKKKSTPAEEDKSSTVALELVNSNDSQVEELDEI